MRPFRIFHFIVLLGLALASVGIASAGASETRRIGNTDGKPFTAGCPVGMAIVGFGYNSAEQLKSVVPFCREIDAEGHTSGPVPKSGAMVGVAQGNEGKPRVCADGQAVNRLDVAMTPNSAIYYFRAYCRGPGRAPEILKNTGINGGSEGSRGVAECRSGTIATAVVGTYKDTGASQGILSIGLECNVPGGAAAKPNKPADNDDDQGDDAGQGNGGDDNGLLGGFEVKIDKNGIKLSGKGGGSAGQRVANTDTTVYGQPGGNEIGYLDAGTRVTVAGCEDGGQGWCEIRKPMRGYVWGGDLD